MDSAATTGRGSSVKDFIGTLDDKTVVTLHMVQVRRGSKTPSPCLVNPLFFFQVLSLFRFRNRNAPPLPVQCTEVT